MKRLHQRLSEDQRGASAVEYGLIVSLIVLAMIGALIQFADTSIKMWNDISVKVVK